MSKTDKTRPRRIREADNKICRPRIDQDTERFVSYKTYKFWIGELLSCCRWCSKNNQQARKEKNRKQRQAGKKEAKRQQIESTAD